MKKVTLISILILALILSTNISFANSNANATNNNELKSAIHQFFDSYFESYKAKKVVSFDGIVESNDNTNLFKSMHEWQVEESKVFSTGYKFYKYNLSFDSINIQKDTANIDLKMSAKYQYEKFDIDSAINNIGFNFVLKLKNEKWVITNIDTDFDIYQNFKKAVEKKTAETIVNQQNSYLTSQVINNTTENVVSRVKTEKINDLQIMKSQFEKSIGTKAVSISEPATNSNFVMAASTYSYTIDNGVAYAKRFAMTVESERFFYTAGSDCTNFASQCVWAAYGGYISGDDTKSKANISNKVRMVSSSWYAGTGGGASNWESVTSFWNYAISSKTVGPLATGYNNGSVYTNLSPSSINMGDVLQARNGSSGDYGHSVYVSYRVPDSAGIPITYDMISVCQHSSNYLNRPLSNLISSWGGSSCNLRELRFRSASFDK